jgi:hypothetical protein
MCIPKWVQAGINGAIEVEFMWCVNYGTQVDCTYGVWMAPLLKYLVAYKIMSYDI